MRVNAACFSILAANPRVRMVLFLLGISLAGSALWSVFPGPLGTLLLVVSFIIILISLIVNLFSVCSALFSKNWQLFGERLLVLTVVIPITITSMLLSDYIHLAVLYPYYRLEIAHTSNRPVQFYWGDQALSAIDGVQMRTLMYDDSGKTDITNKLERNDDGFCTERWRLIGHFFIKTVSDCRIFSDQS